MNSAILQCFKQRFTLTTCRGYSEAPLNNTTTVSD